jgi:hypothetical protein
MYDEKNGIEVPSAWTPWGAADHMDTIAEGIVFYSTPSHGGFWLSAERLRQVNKVFREATFVKGGQWYEEDCDAAMVVVSFPQYFEVSMVQRAAESLKRWHPTVAEKCEVPPSRGDRTMTEVYYISDGEQHGRMPLDVVLDNIEANADPHGQITRDIYEAVDMNGFWHGTLENFNVVIVAFQTIQDIDLKVTMARKVARGGSAIVGEG